MNNSRVLAIDYGKKHIGLAHSDEERKFAFPLKTVENKKFLEIKKELQEIIKEKNISEIIIGLPTTFKGEPHKIAKEVINFAQKLEKEFGLPIHFEEERFTSAQARKIHGQESENHAIAASFILENYLSKLNRRKNLKI